MRRRDPEHIADVLKQLFSEREWEEHLQTCLPLLRWQELVGAKIAKQSQPEFFKDGVLQVRVENSVWLNHLRFLGEELRQKLNKKLSPQEVKEIRFRQGPLDPEQPSPYRSDERASKTSKPPAEQLPSLSSEQRRLLGTIPDLELRRALENLLRKQQERAHT